TLGTRSSISPGRSCPSRVASGPASVTQCEDWYKILELVGRPNENKEFALRLACIVNPLRLLDVGTKGAPPRCSFRFRRRLRAHGFLTDHPARAHPHHARAPALALHFEE